jgi:DNA polymerase V
MELPLFESKVSAGFPSPAEEYLQRPLDIGRLLVRNPASTFFIRVMGDSMVGAGINDGDLLVIDRSITPENKSIVLAIVDGEFTVKRLCKKGDQVYLKPENPKYSAIQITDLMQFEVWGVVTYVIHRAC